MNVIKDEYKGLDITIVNDEEVFMMGIHDDDIPKFNDMENEVCEYIIEKYKEEIGIRQVYLMPID